MDPKVNEQLAELLAFVKKGAEATTDFAVEQAPLVAREIVAWTFWQAVVMMAFGVVMLAAAAVCVKIARKVHTNEASYYEDFGRRYMNDGAVFLIIALCAAAIVTTVGGAIQIGTYTPDAIKAVAAPRLVIIDYIGKITK